MQASGMNFHVALIDHNLQVPAGLGNPDRFHVYRNNVVSALIAALLVRYPVVQGIVGAEFFSEMAGRFALASLPDSPVLIEYGAALPEFISRFRCAERLPYLADVARLENAWWQAYHAADCRPLGPEHFSAIPASSLERTRFGFHPSTAIISSPYAIASIWHGQRNGHDLSGLQTAGPETVLICRPELDVVLAVIDPSFAAFLGKLMNGMTLANAAAVNDQSFSLTSALRHLIVSGVVISISFEDLP